MDDSLENLLEEMIRAIGLTNLEREAQEKIVTELGRNMLQRIAIEAYKQLSSEDGKKLEECIVKEDAEGMAVFLREKVPHFDQLGSRIAQEVIHEFKEEFSKV